MEAILGTAGHIDHGKTALTRALTGVDCDRLEEEKRRGITIELGFAWMDLPDGSRVGVVDVPGHERFIKNMAAGASGVDCVLLVVAADEGVMPQTREHLEICSLMGARAGLVALTKIDLADDELIAAAREDIEDALAGGFMGDAPIVPVSSVTGEGLDELRRQIYKLISSLKPRAASDIFRLPVDRVFSVKGFGVVVTGSIASGSCAVGEKLRVYPAGGVAVARSLQAHNAPVETARAGQRCAINLRGLETEDVRRGDVIARPGTLFPSKSWIVKLHCLKSSPLPIRQRMEVHFHHGANECQARIVFRDRETLEPGRTTIAEIKFAEPLAAVYGDHFVIRAHSPLRTIGGGSVICPDPPLLKKRDPDYKRKLEILRELGASAADNTARLAARPPEELVCLSLDLFPAPGLDLNRLLTLTGLSRSEAEDALAALEKKDLAARWDAVNERWISVRALADALEKCRLRAEELRAREPATVFFAHNAFISGWGDALPEKFASEVLELAVKRGVLRREGSGLTLAERGIKLSDADAKIVATALEKLKNGDVSPPFVREICEETGVAPKKLAPLLKYLCDTGRILKIREGVYYDKQKFAEIIARVRDWFAENDELDVGDLKTILGVSRKYAIPILEYLDSIHETVRVNGKRRLRKK